MIPTWKAFWAFVVAQVCVTMVALYAISKVNSDAAAQALVASAWLILSVVSGPLAIYITGKVGEMIQRRKDPSSLAEQTAAEAAALKDTPQ